MGRGCGRHLKWYDRADKCLLYSPKHCKLLSRSLAPSLSALSLSRSLYLAHMHTLLGYQAIYLLCNCRANLTSIAHTDPHYAKVLPGGLVRNIALPPPTAYPGIDDDGGGDGTIFESGDEVMGAEHYQRGPKRGEVQYDRTPGTSGSGGGDDEDPYATVMEVGGSEGTYNLLADMVGGGSGGGGGGGGGSGGGMPRYEQQPPTFMRHLTSTGKTTNNAEDPYSYVAGSHKNAPTEGSANAAPVQQPISASLLEPELEAFLKKLKLLDKCAQLADDAGISESSDFGLFTSDELVRISR